MTTLTRLESIDHWLYDIAALNRDHLLQRAHPLPAVGQERGDGRRGGRAAGYADFADCRQHINFYGRYEFIKGPEPINVKAIIEKLALESLLHKANSG